ncbi:MAG TPA: methyltransferase domain-containing protein [Candidatus Poseidoniia archaeon]|nr:methyltransferase domain-containing protein [Candidatus Poseidoniia archaeon]
MIKHLRVADSKAQEAKISLEKSKALNDSFLPIKEEGYILWPLNFEVEGEIIECEGVSSTRLSRDYRLRLPRSIREIAPRAFDIFGDIAIVKLSDLSMEHSKIISETLLESHTNISKVALDLGVKGEYRIRDLKMLIGDSDFVATHRENGFKFKLDISKVYFSPRLAMERKRIFDIAGSNEEILDAFAGASPFAVSLASKGCEVTAVDANPNSEKWSHKNFELNNVDEYNFICSKIEDILPSLPLYDRIIMNNPTNSLPYLKILSKNLKPNGTIHLYNITEDGEDFEVKDYLPSNFKCVFERVVHPYSPQSSLMVSDIIRLGSNVQKTNQ